MGRDEEEGGWIGEKIFLLSFTLFSWGRSAGFFSLPFFGLRAENFL